MKKFLSAAAMLPFFLWGCALLKPHNEDTRQSFQGQAESPMASSPSLPASITPPSSPGLEPLAPSTPSPNGNHSQPTKAQVRIVQQRLKTAGMDPGPSDGVLGPKTKAALRKYQELRGISGNGALDEQTLDSLGVK